jgi:hypothetical protein
MPIWFLLAGNEPRELKEKFDDFFSQHNFPQGIALWKWKRSCWICSPEKFKGEILAAFTKYGVVEFSSAPSTTDIEFMCGDDNALTVPS